MYTMFKIGTELELLLTREEQITAELSQFSYLLFFDQLRYREESGIDDAGYSEGSSNNCANLKMFPLFE